MGVEDKKPEASRIIVQVGDGSKIYADIIDEFAMFYGDKTENIKKLYDMEVKQGNKNARWHFLKKYMVIRYPNKKRLEILKILQDELKEVERQKKEMEKRK